MILSISSLSIKYRIADDSSDKLCGGIFVDIPTAMPEAPFNNRLGILDGKTTGSCKDSSKLFAQSTVSFPISKSISSAVDASFASVYLIAAGESPSIDPKFPWPSTIIYLIEKSCAIRAIAS